MTYNYICLLLFVINRRRLYHIYLVNLAVQVYLSTQRKKNMSHIEDGTFSQNECPFLTTAIYKSIEDEKFNMVSLFAVMEIILNKSRGTNSEMSSCFRALLNGKCQKDTSERIMKFWDELKGSVQKLSVSFSY